MKKGILLILILALLSPLSSIHAEDTGTEMLAVEMTEKGWRYFAIGEQATALKRFRQAIILDPGYAPGYYGVGYIYSLQDRLSLAIQYYRKAIELADIPDSQSYAKLGLALMKLGKQQEGLRMIEQALQIDPANGEAHISLADYYCREKNAKLARVHLETAKHIGVSADPQLIEEVKTGCP